MSTHLIDALRGLNLRPGETYRAKVDGQTFEVRAVEDVEPTAELAQMVMVNVIADYPYPGPGVIIHAEPGTVELSPPPDIPEDEGPV